MCPVSDFSLPERRLSRMVTHNQVTLRWRELHSRSKLRSPARVRILWPPSGMRKEKPLRGAGSMDLTNVCSTSQSYHCCGNDGYEPLSSCSCVGHGHRKEVARNGVWMETIVAASGLDWICAFWRLWCYFCLDLYMYDEVLCLLNGRGWVLMQGRECRKKEREGTVDMVIVRM